MSRVGAPRLRPRRPYVCVGCVGGAGLRLLRGAWVDSVCGFWTGLGVLWCWLGAGFGVAGACVVIPCLRSYACWPCLGSVGGIATIGAALRRVAGVSVVYGRKIPRVVAREGRRRVLFRWLCWSCSACLRVFVVVVWLVFVGGLGGIATIGAALRRVAGVSVVYGRKIPRVVARKGQCRVPVEGSMVAKPPSACSKCSRPRWNGGDMGFLGCSGRRFGRAGSWRGVFCAAACRVRRASVRAAGMIELTVGA